MPTNDKKVQIYLKKFLTQQQMSENFLEYLLKAARGNLETIYPLSGVFRGGLFSSAVADQFTLSTPLKATDGKGHLLSLDPSEAVVPFENAVGVDYFVGLRFNEIFQEVETNVRTGQVEYTFFQERIGELAEPNSLVDNGSDLTIIIDSVAEAGVSHAGRKCIVYKKRAEKLTDAFEEITVVWDGSNNKITTLTLLGQQAGLVSVDAADYQVFLIGPTVRRNTDLRLDPEIAFLGIVEGAGAGVAPSVFDDSDKNILFDSETFNALMELEKSFLTSDGSVTWDLATETISWSAPLIIRVPMKSYDYTIAIDSIASLSDGDVLFFEADQVGGVRPLIQVANGGVPFNPNAEPIAFREGNNVYFRDGVLELQGDAGSSTVGRIDGITQDLLTYMGADNESDATPTYSNTNYVTDETPLNTGISALDGAMRIINNLMNQNKTAKLIGGGVWSWDLLNEELSFSADAFLQVAGLSNARNTLPIASSPILLDDDGDVAYIEINRDTGAASNRPIIVDAITALAGQANNDIFIIARRVGDNVIVGTNSFKLSAKNNKLELDGALDEIHRFFSSLRLKEHPTNKKRIIITGADETLLDGTILGQQISSLLMKFSGAEIDVEAGKVFEDDGSTDLGLDFVFPAIPFDEFHFFSISIIPSTVNVADNTINVQVLVIPGESSNVALVNTPRSPFGSGIKLGQFYIQREANPLTSILPITQDQISQLGTGGSADGSGDASNSLIDMKALLDESFYRFLEPNVFAIDQDDKIDNATGAFSFATNTFDLDSGELLETIALLDPVFLASLNDILIAQVALIYLKGEIDSDPTVEITPNGDLADLQTVTMERLSDDNDTYIGELIIDLAALTQQILDEYNVSEADAIDELEDATVIQGSQEFTTAAETEVYEEIEVYLNKVGTPIGFYKVNLHEDNAGDPGPVLSQVLVNVESLSAGNNAIPINIGRHVLSPSTKYHISVETDQEYKDSFATGVTAVSLRVDNSAPTIPARKVFNGTIWSTVAGSSMVYKLSGRVVDLRMRITATDDSKLVAYGVYYGEEAKNVQRLKRRAQFIFNGTTDKAIYNLGFQIPWDVDLDFVEVVDVFAGQTWESPVVSLNGTNVIVLPEDFWGDRDTVQLKIKQIEGGQFDSSPENANLLTENFAGSNDPAIDKSVSGRGPKVRAEDVGLTLVELTVDADFNLVIKEA